ncbi:hypothetical protein [Flavobacterium sp.]|uniref:hypothetical protein n=1 Tax=Flavobacterium sp. TaxID=239 RepID=UPI003D6AD2E6
MKKIVLTAALIIALGALITSCNKKVETSNDEPVATEQIAPEVVDSVKTDTVAPMVEPKDSISKK